MTPEIASKLADIDAKYAEAAQLRKQLDGSLAIKALWPEAFDHGTCKLGARATVHEPHKGTITITRGDGSKKEFAAMDVPFKLWPAGMQADFEAMPAYRKRSLIGALK